MKASNEFEKAISAYLEEVKDTYPNLSEALIQEGKTITNCCNYIIQEVQKKKVNAMADQDVFDLAIDYYLNEKITNVKETKCKVVMTSDKVSPAKKETKPKSEKTPKETHPNQMSIFDLLENEA